MLKFVLFISICIFVSALTANFSEAASRPDEDNLTQDQAHDRREQIKNVDYDVFLKLKKGEDKYEGKVVIKVDLEDVDPLSIDFKTKKIESVKVNDKALSNYITKKGFIEIPEEALTESNKIEISYTGEYSKDGDGFQRVVDPEDKTEYIYTDFEPFQAHQLIPCFDQPDLKAKFNLTIEAPEGWVAIGNELVDSAKTANGVTTTVFKTTPKISTYLFFAGAGQFAIWKDKAGNIPLEIYARHSLKKFVDANRIFETTKKGLAFYSDYFGAPYPFSKFGQLFIPEFAWGGMENPGAITLNESMIYRGSPTKKVLDHRNDTILHEMAHMWFGDYVTMSWWNDLWLNESFATYLASLAMERALGSKSAPLDFHSEKGWGYWQDQLSTTHPIETTVRDVRTAKGNFDGITYAKGASSLKQLHFFVGEQGFRTGLRDYFKKYAFSNTSRVNFTDAISKASSVNLDDWTHAWLKTAGPNRIQPSFECSEDGKITNFVMNQMSNASDVLSPHKTQVALYKKNSSGKFEKIKSFDVNFENRETEVPVAKRTQCPDFVLANNGDYDYGLYALDSKSLKNAEDVLKGGIEDSLTRLMVWNALNQMVRDNKLRVSDYMELAMKGIDAEKDFEIVSILLGSHSSISENYFQYLTIEQRVALAPKFEKLIWQKLVSAKTSDLKKVYFDFYNGIAETPEAAGKLAGTLSGKTKVSGVDMDQDRRWKIVSTLTRINAQEAPAIIAAEVKRDPSTKGKRTAEAAKVGISTADAKADFWRSLDNTKDIPYSTLREASGHFDNYDHPELVKKYVDPFFNRVRKLNWEENDNLVEIYFEHLFPQSICTNDLLQQSKKNLEASKTLTAIARRSWTEANDELTKCVSIRANDKTAVKEQN